MIAVLGGECGRCAVNDGSASGDSILRSDPRCSANVGWNSRRRIPTFGRVGAIAVLGGGCSRCAVNDGSAAGDSILRKAIRRAVVATHKRQNAPHEGEAFSLQWRVQ